MTNHSAIGRSNVNRSKNHERQVAKLLTEWSGVEFRRRRTEGRGSAVIEIEGAADVIAIGADFHFSVEAKCGKGFSIDAMLNNLSTTIFTSWWHQSTFDANIMMESRKYQVFPLLFFRPFPNTNWVAFPVKAIDLLKPKDNTINYNNKLWFPHIIYIGYSLTEAIESNVSHSHKNKKIVAVKLDDVILCRWHDFAANIDPEHTFAAIRRRLTTKPNTTTE